MVSIVFDVSTNKVVIIIIALLYSFVVIATFCQLSLLKQTTEKEIGLQAILSFYECNYQGTQVNFFERIYQGFKLIMSR